MLRNFPDLVRRPLVTRFLKLGFHVHCYDGSPDFSFQGILDQISNFGHFLWKSVVLDKVVTDSDVVLFQ